MARLGILTVGFLIFILLPRIGFGQQTIGGGVFDKASSTPLEGVTIEIISLLDSTTITTQTNKGGVFTTKKLPAGKYKINIASLGYTPETQEISLGNKPLYQSFRLELSEVAIEEVAVAARQAVVMKGDTTEFDASNYATREHADADELVAQIPGVQLDEEGNVVAQGEQINRIIVDGKEFFSTDPRVALKMLPAEIISKVQIIDEKSEQARFSGFDDGERNKVINIVTKPERRVGYFGRVLAGKGDSDKYSVNTNISAFDGDRRYALLLMANNVNETNAGEIGRGRFRSGGGGNNTNTERGIAQTYSGSANFNDSYFDQKMEVNANYRFRWNDTETNTLSNTEYLIGARANQFRDQVQFSDQRNNEHNAHARVRWDIDSTNRLDFSPTIGYTGSYRFNTNFSTTTREQVERINQTDRSNQNESSNFRFGADLTYMHRFKKPGRTISLNANGNMNSNDALGLNLATTEYYEDALLDRIDTNNNRSVTNGYGSGFNTRLSLTESLGQLNRLQLNYNFRNTASYSDRETFEFLAETGQIGELRDRLSNEFRNDFNFHSGGLSYSYNKRDTLRIQVGLNYQYGQRHNNRTVPVQMVTQAGFGSWLPSLTVQHYFTREKSIEFNYNTSTNTPNINQLQDFINNQNELRITNGNPDLDQEYMHRLELRYRDVNRESGRSLNSSIHYEYVNNRIVNSVLMTDTTIQLLDDVILGAGGQYTVPVNMDGAYNLRMRNDYGLPITNLKMNVNFNTNLFFNNNLGLVNDERVPSQSYGFTQGININSNFSRQHIISLGYSVNGRYTENPLNMVPKFNVYTHRFSNTVTLEFLKNFVLNSNLLYLYNGGINGQEGIETTIWNASLGYKVLKSRSAELSVRGFDLLNNAQNVNRTVNQISASSVTSNTLNRYFLLSFTYNLRHFSGGSGQSDGQRNPGRRGR